MKENKLKHIELFAGCGGMSLGLEKAGFNLYFANELSPMAGETFAYNILEENLQKKAKENINAEKVKWIRSKYPNNGLSERLRENPSLAKNGKYSDIKSVSDLKNRLLIGDIDQLLNFFYENEEIVAQIRKEGIDLLSGGPPCQSFSMAGKREKNNSKNLLPLSFARITGLLQPKMVLLENVKGITSPFDELGNKYYAWLEVSKAFVLEGYVPVCMLLNSKYFGVAQNRPRYIMYAFRIDVFQGILSENINNDILNFSHGFYEKVLANAEKLQTVTIDDFKYYDIESQPDLFNGIILPKITTQKGKFISTLEAIEDLRDIGSSFEISQITNNYGKNLLKIFKRNEIGSEVIKNHEPRSHGFAVKARFRFYQILSKLEPVLKKAAKEVFRGKIISLDIQNRLFSEFSKYEMYFLEDGTEVYKVAKSREQLMAFIKSITSKKHSQRALIQSEPAPAQLTIPDDLCHYDQNSLRTLTVREMARFQSFPDWFEFRSKVTTGGKNRSFEVPQYTQVGNAVPPMLALTLGRTIARLLDTASKTGNKRKQSEQSAIAIGE